MIDVVSLDDIVDVDILNVDDVDIIDDVVSVGVVDENEVDATDVSLVMSEENYYYYHCKLIFRVVII